LSLKRDEIEIHRPRIRQEPVAAAVAHDVSKRGEMQMHAGNGLPVGGETFESGTAGRSRARRIDVHRHGHLGPRHLQFLHMHDVAPDQERGVVGSDHETGMPRRATRR